ncbi:MAG: diacylglycerol/lipid kinase family protein [Phycisphaerae bacterium]
MEPNRQRFAAIVNPASGRRDHLAVVKQLAERLDDVGASLEILVSEYPGHPTQLARELSSDIEAAVVVGGDGTINEVLNGLLPRRLPLLIWSRGTANLLGRGTGIPPRLSQFVDVLRSGDSHLIDAGNLNGRYFHSIAGVGFDAACIDRMERGGHIAFGDFFWPIWRAFWAFTFPRLRVHVRGDLVFEGRASVMIGNQPFYGPSIRAFPSADPSDGLLDLCIMPAAHHLELLYRAAYFLAERQQGSAGFICSRSDEVSVDVIDPVHAHVDGELLEAGRIDIRVERQAIRLLRCRNGRASGADPAARARGCELSNRPA